MDASLRCNSLKCRAPLRERAVVTTCSHIFCIRCSDHLGLSDPNPPNGNRLCPACQTSLPNPDDAVSTQLNPTEDYKTSVLSGFSPTTIMECSGRGLAFWSYQVTQEIVYQEYLAKTLTDKYGNLSIQMDKIINDANSEIENLNQKLSVMQMDQDKLKTENANLVTAFREKSRKHQQTQELYDRLKRKEMTAATRSAAFESADEVLGAASSRHHTGVSPLPNSKPFQPDLRTSYHTIPPYSTAQNGVEQLHSHQRNGSNGSGGSGRNLMPPPPIPRQGAPYGNQGLGPGGNLAIPSSHRTQLGTQQQIRNNTNFRHAGSALNTSIGQTPSHRQPLSNQNMNSANRPNMGGYGMSAGMKIGRQQPIHPAPYGSSSQSSSNFIPASGALQPPQIYHDQNRYY